MYLYHAVRSDSKDKIVVSLAKLYKSSEELYKGDMSKFPNQYNRENQAVKILNCKKRDVVFLTAILPKVLGREYQRRTGISFKGTQFYKIPLKNFDLSKMCLYLTFDKDDKGEFYPIDDKVLENFNEYKKYSQDAIDYWENCKFHDPSTGSLLFAGTYLFLYNGDIDVSKCEIVEV
ncbi:MAG: hypothetical protein ACRCYE_14090 [Sarcina sp.]